jgi:drug/metabolite transporter (DMT)-like permease
LNHEEPLIKFKHWLIFLLLGTIWSSSFAWIKIALQELGPVTLVAFRVLFGLLFGVLAIYIQRVQWPRNFRSWPPLLLLGLTNIAIPFCLISWSEQTIDSTVAALLFAIVPLFTIFSAHSMLPDDKITLPKVLGLFLGSVGIIVLMTKDLASASRNSLLAQAAVLLASAFYAGSSVYARKTTKDMPNILRSAGPLISSTVVMWLAIFLFESPIEMPQLGTTWLALIWLGVLGSGVAFVMWYYLIHEIGPTRTTMAMYVFPLRSVILGVTFLHEQMTWQLLAGTVFILVGLAIANWHPQIGTGFPIIDK